MNVRWGPKDVAPTRAREHFLVSGATGSGKTVLINMLLRSVFDSEFAARRRALIYDPKQEIVSYLYGMRLDDRLKILHPFDKRSVAWNLAEDIDTPISARELATILVPQDEGGDRHQSFFTGAVRDLLTGVVLTFVRCTPHKKTWTFRDVILAMLYEPYLRCILAQEETRDGAPFPQVTRLRESYLDSADPETVANIRSTINTKLSIFEPVAAVWAKAKETFSLAHWLDDKDPCHDILVLGNDEAARAALDTINRVLFKRFTEMVLNRRELTEDEQQTGDHATWVFLDEVREAGPLDGLSRLLTKGRTKGACIVLGFQDIEGLRDVYGEQIAHEITGQCHNVAILKMNSPSTAEWGANLFGHYLRVEEQTSIQIGPEGLVHSVTKANQERAMLYTQELLFLPITNRQNGLTGFFRYPTTQPQDQVRYHMLWERDIKKHLPSPSNQEGEVNFDPRDPEDQYLQPWTSEDWERLGFSTKGIALPHYRTNPSDSSPSRRKLKTNDTLHRTAGI